ncbi:hypothetical protein AAG906_000819 [Vitis piasezkii]
MASARYLDKSFSLAARLHADDDSSSKCWESLLELQACTGEVVLFFLNGETHLGAGCCQAIQTIEHQCWPAMLTSIGFTAEEGDILQGYCDATTSSSAPHHHHHHHPWSLMTWLPWVAFSSILSRTRSYKQLCLLHLSDLLV